MEILKFILCVYGITFFLQHKAYPILSKNAFLKSMLECTFCTGFHGGWMTYVLTAHSSVDVNLATIFSLVSFGFVGASSAYILDAIVSKIEGQ